MLKPLYRGETAGCDLCAKPLGWHNTTYAARLFGKAVRFRLEQKGRSRSGFYVRLRCGTYVLIAVRTIGASFAPTAMARWFWPNAVAFRVVDGAFNATGAVLALQVTTLTVDLPETQILARYGRGLGHEH